MEDRMIRGSFASVLACFVIVAAGVVTPTRAATVSIVADRDNTLFESATGDISNGAGPSLFVGTTETNLERRALLHFDVASAVPVEATVESAVLTLHLSRANTTVPQSVDVRRVLFDWGEGTSDSSGNLGGGQGAPATTGDATWLHRFFDTELWTNPGGDFGTVSTATTDVVGEGTYTWTSTLLAQQVQSFSDNPGENFGWLLIGNDEARRFDSRESANAANRPTLSITFSTPDGGGGGGGVIPLPPALLPGIALLVLAWIVRSDSLTRLGRRAAVVVVWGQGASS
jgi:hypothetical protein